MASISYDVLDCGKKMILDKSCVKAGIRDLSADSFTKVSGNVAPVLFNRNMKAVKSKIFPLKSRNISSSTVPSNVFTEGTLLQVTQSQQPEHQTESRELDSILVSDNDKDSMEARIFSNLEEAGGLETWIKESLADSWLTNDSEPGEMSSAQSHPRISQALPADQNLIHLNLGETNTQIHEYDISRGHSSAGADLFALPEEWNGLSGEATISERRLNSTDEYSSDEYLQLSGSTDQHWSLLSDSMMSFSEDSVDAGAADESTHQSFGIDGGGRERESSIEKQVAGQYLNFVLLSQGVRELA